MQRKNLTKTQKEDYRAKKWKKRICLTEENYDYIHEMMIKKKYKTMAGTLDAILNQVSQAYERKTRKINDENNKRSNH